MMIRKAAMKDLEEIKKLNQELFFHDYRYDKTLDLKWPDKHREYFRRKISGKDSIAFVAEEKGKIIGYIIAAVMKAENYRTFKKMVELENMLIIKKYRGMGIGKVFIKKCIVWARKKGIKRLRIIATAGNKEAIAAYKKIGFVEHNIILEADV